MTLPTALTQALPTVTGLAAAAVGGGLGIFSVMVMPALNRLPATEAVGAMQRINEAALTPPFLGVFMGAVAGSVAVAAVSLIDRGASGTPWGLHLAGAACYVAAFAITGAINVPANEALAAVVPTDAPSAARAWADFAPGWTGANHVRSLLGLAGGLLMMWR